jgi:hypothetical protein
MVMGRQSKSSTIANNGKGPYKSLPNRLFEHTDLTVPWEDLLNVLTVGGEVVLKGMKFINRQAYAPHTMERVFMQRERALVS